jgi:hypothetical protein
MKPITIDTEPSNADWLRLAWKLPPYKSKEFFQQVRDLEAFKKLPLYSEAVRTGLILDDEWVADYVKGWKGFDNQLG